MPREAGRWILKLLLTDVSDVVNIERHVAGAKRGRASSSADTTPRPCALSCAPPQLERAVSGRLLLHALLKFFRYRTNDTISCEPIGDYPDHQRDIQATKLRPHASHQYGCLQILVWNERFAVAQHHCPDRSSISYNTRCNCSHGVLSGTELRRLSMWSSSYFSVNMSYGMSPPLPTS
jgi:hypothetical protein